MHQATQSACQPRSRVARAGRPAAGWVELAQARSPRRGAALRPSASVRFYGPVLRLAFEAGTGMRPTARACRRQTVDLGPAWRPGHGRRPAARSRLPLLAAAALPATPSLRCVLRGPGANLALPSRAFGDAEGARAHARGGFSPMAARFMRTSRLERQHHGQFPSARRARRSGAFRGKRSFALLVDQRQAGTSCWRRCRPACPGAGAGRARPRPLYHGAAVRVEQHQLVHAGGGHAFGDVGPQADHGFRLSVSVPGKSACSGL